MRLQVHRLPLSGYQDAAHHQPTEPSRSIMSAELILALLRNPATTGTLLPSSPTLASVMADAAQGADLVVELGAGTGAVTQALLTSLPDVPLIAVEVQESLARNLAARFPNVEVRASPARDVVDALIAHPGKIMLVSSLPFRSLPAPARAETIDSICRFLAHAPGRELVQFTYQPREPFAPPQGLRWYRHARVWRNIPPAGVWRLAVS